MASRWQQFRNESAFLRDYLVRYRKYVLWGLLTLIIVDGLDALIPLILKEVIDSIGLPEPQRKLACLAILFLCITILQGVCRYGWRALLVKGSMLAGKDIREKFAEHLFNSSASFYDRKRIGDLMALATNDTEAIRMALGMGVIIFADAVFYFLTIPIAMYLLSPQLTLLAFLPLPLVPFLVWRQEREIHRRFKKAQKAFADLSAQVQESLMGIRVSKAFARETHQVERFRNTGDRYVKRSLHLARVQSVFGPDLDFLMSVGIVLLLLFGGKWTMDGAITLGTFVAFQRYIQKMIWPMEAIGMVIGVYQRAVASSNRLQSVYNEHPDVVESMSPMGLLPERRSPVAVEFRNLTFSYPGTSRPVLSNVSFSIQPGEHVALVGPIGSGKSTLLYLLARLYPVPRGMIFIDGIDVNDWQIEALRTRIGFVTQDTFLFNSSIAENLSLGLKEDTPSMEEIESAAMISAVHEDILHMSEGYETHIGERGIRVSGGQKQRLTIARALMKKPDLLLLDDALSSVDIQTEKRILKALVERQHQCTEIIVAHRLSSVQHANKIVVLVRGVIEAVGCHESLTIRKSGTYWKFYQQQQLEEEFDAFTRQLDASSKS